MTSIPSTTLLSLALCLSLYTNPSFSLDLSSHCTSPDTPGECPCSRRETFTSLNFCLSSTSHPSTCRQRPCASRYVCDCAGDTLCRAVPSRTALTCTGPIAADGTCDCLRTPALRAAGAASSSELVPLRRIGTLRASTDILPQSAVFCSERPTFWATAPGLALLERHWSIIASGSARRTAASSRMLLFGHVGHAVSFTSPSALSDVLPLAREEVLPVGGEYVDPGPGSAVNRLTAECLAASVSMRLATHGVATRGETEAVPFQMAERMVLKPCAYLPATNAALGMNLASFMERATLATGDFPLDDAALSHEDVVQACTAINRNFESCQVDLGCVGVTL